MHSSSPLYSSDQHLQMLQFKWRSAIQEVWWLNQKCGVILFLFFFIRFPNSAYYCTAAFPFNMDMLNWTFIIGGLIYIWLRSIKYKHRKPFGLQGKRCTFFIFMNEMTKYGKKIANLETHSQQAFASVVGCERQK